MDYEQPDRRIRPGAAPNRSGKQAPTGALEAAYSAFAAWVEQTRTAGNLAFALASGFYLAEIRLAQGQVREAARLYRQFLTLVPADHEALRMAAPTPASGAGRDRPQAG